MTSRKTNGSDPATLEREVKQTQEEIGDTVDELEERLNPQDIGRSILGDSGSDIAEEAIDVTRRNPIPVAMIAIGLIWLLASSNAPAIRRVRERITGFGGDKDELRSRSEEPAPIGPPPSAGERFDRRSR